MVEHKHWKRRSEEGIGTRKQHIAVVGYSHYGDPSKDSSDFTQWALKTFISGDQIGERFFPPIQSYFGFEDQPEFWNRVHFFNFVPKCFPKKQKFASANGELLKRSQERFLEILQQEKPDKVFVFTRKGWNQCPYTLEEAGGGRCKGLKANGKDTWGTYELDGHKVQVCGFRHPLYATHEEVKASVQEFLLI